ncbi:NUDIX hydrolase [Metabacillus sp. 84]|uniref:NUDIX hydrolase n=1 Tax=unclassified Metabacillus TaxID=2675274 RepID=UPI003CE98A2D
MDQELLRIFDVKGRPIGTASRQEVHKKGFWHETFHCWIAERSEDGIDLYFQLRSPLKKDYPSLYDITAAGHLLAGETAADGIREVKEELGLSVCFHELHPLGVIPWTGGSGEIIDKELAHVYVYLAAAPIREFSLQKEEVAGVVKANLADYEEMILGGGSRVRVTGFREDISGKRTAFEEWAGKAAFVPHAAGYYKKLFKEIRSLSQE